MTDLGSILKSRDSTLPTKVRLVKAIVFAVVMYGCESWTVKKAERRRIDAFELWCWTLSIGTEPSFLPLFFCLFIHPACMLLTPPCTMYHVPEKTPSLWFHSCSSERDD